MGVCNCMHAYSKDVIMCKFLVFLLVLSVLGYFNFYVEGRLTMNNNISTSTMDGSTSTMDGNIIDGKANVFSTKITIRNKNDNNDQNSSNNSITFNNIIKSSNSSRDTIINNLIINGKNNLTLCRCMPDSACWPSLDAWNTLNRSLGGVLVKPSPPASPCYKGPNQNAAACQIAATNWMNPFWRADQVGAMQYANKEAHGNQSCSLFSSPYFISSAQNPLTSHPSSTSGNASLPPRDLAVNASPLSSASSQCQQGAIPFYAVEVLHPSHVQTAVTFAAQNNLRFSVKSTGHDVLGRSTAPGSLNIWMHRMKNITFHDSFTPDGCDAIARFSAVTADSGTQWEELYAAAHAKNLVVVGAMSGSVSTGGGFVQGGGHSPLSPFLGLAADNVVEMKVVTADGHMQTANACQNQDLFWALRGGGGGTFGIVLSCTHITYPALDSMVNVHITATSDNGTLFEELLSEFVYLQSSLSQENYWAGYSYITSSPTLSLTLNYLAPNCNTSLAQASFESLLNFTIEHSNEITMNVSMKDFPSFKSWHSEVLCSANPGICSDPSGLNTALASRLLPNSVLQEQPSQVAHAFMEILANGVQQIVGHLVGGQTVSSSQSFAERAHRSKLDQRSLDTTNDVFADYAGSQKNAPTMETSEWVGALNATNGVNPAWRKALWHVVLINFWGDQQESPADKVVKVTQMNGLLRELSPGSGCYLNEADVNEPNWQQAFFGENYNRLKRIKSTVDPEGLFTCTNCVGSEEWTINDQLICRRPSS